MADKYARSFFSQTTTNGISSKFENPYILRNVSGHLGIQKILAFVLRVYKIRRRAWESMLMGQGLRVRMAVHGFESSTSEDVTLKSKGWVESIILATSFDFAVLSSTRVKLVL